MLRNASDHKYTVENKMDMKHDFLLLTVQLGRWSINRNKCIIMTLNKCYEENVDQDNKGREEVQSKSFNGNTIEIWADLG